MWKADWHLSFLLGLLVLVIFVIYPLAGRHGPVVGIVLQSFFSLILISGVVLASRRRTARAFAILLAVATAATGWLRLFAPAERLTMLGVLLLIVFLAMLAAVILIRVFDGGRITVYRVQGAIAAYLLLGVIWSGFYRLVVYMDPAAFNLPAGEDEGTLMSRLIYFSFATLTTVAYGDVAPVDTAARSLAMLEALTGQLFPVVLIGRLVSLEVSHRKQL